MGRFVCRLLAGIAYGGITYAVFHFGVKFGRDVDVALVAGIVACCAYCAGWLTHA